MLRCRCSFDCLLVVWVNSLTAAEHLRLLKDQIAAMPLSHEQRQALEPLVDFPSPMAAAPAKDLVPAGNKVNYVTSLPLPLIFLPASFCDVPKTNCCSVVQERRETKAHPCSSPFL